MTPWRKIMSVRGPWASFGGTKAQISFGSVSSSGAHQGAGVVEAEDGEAVAAGAGSSAAAGDTGNTGNRGPARAKAPRAAARQGGALIETCVS
jgi:hypothetical protein